MDVTPKWKTNGAAYLPLLAIAEIQRGIPTDLLARIAYQECRWRPEVINGTVTSSRGAVGMMQMLPKYFPNVNLTDPQAAANVAAIYLQSLHKRFGRWILAVAAYNAGPGNVHKYGGVPPFVETQHYVVDIGMDVGYTD